MTQSTSSSSQPATPTSTIVSASNGTSQNTSPDKRKPEETYYSSVTSFESQFSARSTGAQPMRYSASSPTKSEPGSSRKTSNDLTPTGHEHAEGFVGMTVAEGYRRRNSGEKGSLRAGKASPLTERPQSLPPSSPAHTDYGERRLSLYDNVDVYYNAHYEQSMEESLEAIGTPTAHAEHGMFYLTGIDGEKAKQAERATSTELGNTSSRYKTRQEPLTQTSSNGPPKPTSLSSLPVAEPQSSRLYKKRTSWEGSQSQPSYSPTKSHGSAASSPPMGAVGTSPTRKPASPINGIQYYQPQVTYI